MKTEVAAKHGPPYLLERRGRVYSITRNIGNHNNRIMFSRKDLINVCNALVDLIDGTK